MVGGTLHVGILGPLHVHVEGSVVDIVGVRRQSLVARLAIARGAVIPVERLAHDLWGDEADDRSVPTLRTYVTKLRRVLGHASPALVSAQGGYRLDVAPGALDADRFESLLSDSTTGSPAEAVDTLLRALSEWRGHVLDGMASQPWAEGEVARLELLRVGAWERLIAARLQLHQHTAAVADLERLVREHPYHEPFRVQLVEGLYRSGRQAAALAAQREGVEVLRSDLGLEPGPQLAALESAILDHASWLQAPEHGAVVVPRIDLVPQLPELLRPRSGDPSFVGRHAELRTLQRLLGRPRDDGPKMALVRGEPGIGKTRLVAHVAAEAIAGGHQVCVGRCVEGLAVPYGPLIDGLRPLLSNETTALLAGLLGNGPHDDGMRGDPVVARRRLLDGFTAAVEAVLVVGPMLFVIDDLQWAAPSTVAALGHLLADVRGPLTILATARTVDPEPAHTLLDLISASRRRRTIEVVDLGGLDEQSIAELFASEHATGPDVPALVDATGGNPFFLTELARWPLVGDVPTSVRDVLAPRLGRVSSLARQVATTGASHGLEFDLLVIAAAMARQRDELFDALDELTAVGIIAPTGSASGYRFCHELARRVVEDSLSPARRSSLHRRLAEALGGLDEPGGRNDAAVEQIARQWERAGPEQAWNAARWRAWSGRIALTRYAWDEAATQLRTALESAGRDAPLDWTGRVLLDLSEAQARAGRADDARSTVKEAAAVAQRADDPTALARAALWGTIGGRGNSAWHADATRLELLEAARTALLQHEVELRVRVTGELALARFQRSERPLRQSLAREAVDLAEADGRPSVIAAALPASRVRFWHPSDVGSRAAFARSVLAIAESSADPWLLGDALDAVRTDAHEVGDLTTFDAADRRMEQLAIDTGSVHLRWRAAVARAHRALRAGRFDETETLAAAALAEWGDEPAPDAVVAFGAQLAVARVIGGRAHDAVSLMSALGDAPHEQLVVEAARASVLASAGVRDEASTRLWWCIGDDLANVPHDSGYLFGLAVLAEAAAELGDRKASALLLDALAPHVALLPVMIGPGISWGSVAQVVGVLHVALGVPARGRPLLEQAVRLETAFGLVPWAARARRRLDELAA